MAWLHVIKGAEFKFSGEYEELSKLEEQEEFKAFCRSLIGQDLHLSTLHDCDKETFSVFMGKELLESRHLYVGQTETLDDKLSDEESALISQRVLDLKAVLADSKLGLNLIDFKTGIVLSIFD